MQELFTFPLTLIPRKTQLPESHHWKYQRPGSKNTSAQSSQCSAVCEIECDACLASVCICGGVNEATVTCLLLAVWLIILWGLLLPHGARPVWACGRPGKRASSISPLHRRSQPARQAPTVGWIADASHCPPPSSSLRAITCLASLMEMGTLCKGRGHRWFLCMEFLWDGAWSFYGMGHVSTSFIGPGTTLLLTVIVL